jgi:hypothetical protein
MPDNERKSKMKLDELVQKISTNLPWKVESLNRLLGVNLRQDYSTDLTASYVSEEVALDDGVKIKQIELRTNKEHGEEPVLIIIDLDTESACINYEHIKESYPGIVFTGGPLSEVLQTSYSTMQPWGRLTFEIPESGCLSGIIFNNKKYDEFKFSSE